MPSPSRRAAPIHSALALLSFAALALAPASASANGQSTHLWITDHALTHLPEGPLADFLGSPELRKMLDNGTMFPDGGYPLDDPYAEIAHWEPFQSAYLDWIVDQYDAPYTGEGAEHLAFLMGMASHGMADQAFDSLYGERVKLYDGAIGEFDTASDIIFMSAFEPRMAPTDWVPYDVLDGLYSDAAGYDVDPETMVDGQNLLRIAVNAVAIFSQMPDEVAEQAIPFPWGSEHLHDPETSGSPPCEGELVARYWRVLWALAHEQPLPGPVLGTLPADGGSNHPTDASTLESWVTVAFARGLETAPLTADAFTLEAEGGATVELDIWHYYGQDAHIVHLQPQVDLAPDTVYTVTVDPGVATIHGDALEGYSFRFSTGPDGPDPTVPEWPSDHDPNEDPGETDTDTGTDADAGTETETETGTDASDSSDSSAGGTTDSAAVSEDGAGCSCAATRPRAIDWALLVVGFGLGLGIARRRTQVTGSSDQSSRPCR